MNTQHCQQIYFKKAGIVLILLFVFISMFNASCSAASSKSKTKKANEKSYDIAIVYDNTMSMYYEKKDYTSPKTDWSCAKYAVGVFASMLNDNSALRIYPMNPVKTHQGEFAYDSPWSSIPKLKKGQESVDLIDEMNTLKLSANTPIQTVESAAENLLKSGNKAAEKHLIILSDGGFYDVKKNDSNKKNTKVSASDLNAKLEDYAKKGISVQFLNIGRDLHLPSRAVKFYSCEPTGEALIGKLTQMCNNIFQRNSLGLNGEKFDIDVAMSSLIVFVQGQDVDVDKIKIKGAKGKIYKSTDVIGIKHSGEPDYESKGQKYPKKSAKGLSGAVAIFDENFSAGKYSIEGLDDVSEERVVVYYEPDVDIFVKITDEQGRDVTSQEKLPEGKYTIEGILKDHDKKDVTGAKLLTNIMNENSYDDKVLFAGEEKVSGKKLKFDGKRSEIDLKAGTKCDFTVFSEYLGNRISSDDNPNIKLKYEITTALNFVWGNSPDIYAKNEKDKWQENPIIVNLDISGKSLSTAELNIVLDNLEVSFGENKEINENQYRIETDFKHSALKIFIGYPEKNKYAEIDDDNYEMVLTSRIQSRNAYGTSEEYHFKIQPVTPIVIFGIVLFGIFVISVMTLFVISRRVLPRRVYYVVGKDEGIIPMAKGEMIDITDGKNLECRFEPETKLLKIRSPQAQFRIVELNPPSNMNSIKIDAYTLKKKSGQWYLDGQKIDLGKLPKSILVKNQSRLTFTKSVHDGRVWRKKTERGVIYINPKRGYR